MLWPMALAYLVMVLDVWTIVVAAGSGRRFGGPKQFVALAGRPLLAWALEAAAEVSTGVVVVVPADRLEHLARLRPQLPGIDAVVAGGATRSESVRRPRPSVRTRCARRTGIIARPPTTPR